MTVPVIVKPPEPGSAKRARVHPLRHRRAAGGAAKLRDLGLTPAEDGQQVRRARRRRDPLLDRGDRPRCPTTGTSSSPTTSSTCRCATRRCRRNARVSSGVDWLSLRLNFESEGVAVTQDELARCLAEGRKYVRLADGIVRASSIRQKVREVLQRQAEILATGGGNGGKLPLSQAGRIEELLGAGRARRTVTADAKELFKKLHDIDEIKGTRRSRATSRRSCVRTRSRASTGSGSSTRSASGGVLADDMGLGKTVQTIALLLAVKSEDAKVEGKRKPFKALIVAPTSVVTNWLREMDKFAPSLRHALWHGAERKERQDELEDADVVVTSYALLRRDEEMLKETRLALRHPRRGAAHQEPAERHGARRQAAARRDRRLALTRHAHREPPLARSGRSSTSCRPGLLGPLDKFEERYSRPIDAGDKRPPQRLRATIHPFILRRTKAEVAQRPAREDRDRPVLRAHRRAGARSTRAVLKEVRAQVMGEVERQGLARSHIQILAGLTRLRQAACDPRLLGLPREFGDEDSGKLVALRELVQTSIEGGHRVLVFSQFVSMLTLIRRAMDEDGVAYEYLDGSTKDRAERVENFQRDDGPPVFLISLKAGGSGLNLTAADTVIHFDPWWNPAVEDQATDRAHRIGQTKVVTTYRLIAKGTIEEKILELGGQEARARRRGALRGRRRREEAHQGRPRGAVPFD